MIDGKLRRKDLKEYLLWLWRENPNIFAYMNEQEKETLLGCWPSEHIKNEENDNLTVQMIIECLKFPKKELKSQLFCNYLKLAAVALAQQEIYNDSSFEEMIDGVMEMACDCICEE